MYCRFFVLFLAALALAGCSTPSSQSQYPMCTTITPGKEGGKGELVLQRIIVIPTSYDILAQKVDSPKARDLAEGSMVLTRIMSEYLSCRDNVIVLSELQEESYAGAFMGNDFERARYIGMQADGDAVLITNLLTYRKLQGNEYGAKEPASISFEYQLIHLKSGTMLCKGAYKDTQKPLLADIFSLSKASKRGFKFVTATTLLKEGLNEKFATCTHLAR